jgi:hypothetical protein
MDINEVKKTYTKLQADLTANEREVQDLYREGKDFYKQRDEAIKNIAKVIKGIFLMFCQFKF